jgi:hypothetical protein
LLDEQESKVQRTHLYLLQQKMNNLNIPLDPILFQEASIRQQFLQHVDVFKFKIVLSNKDNEVCFAIRVGPVLFNLSKECSLVFFDLNNKEPVVFVADIGEVEEDNVEPCVSKLATLIHNWNHEKEYNSITANQYHFVKECHNIIRMYATPEQDPIKAAILHDSELAIKDYIRRSRKLFAQCLRCVLVPSATQSQVKQEKLKKLGFDSQANMIRFKSHKELDKFVHHLRKRVKDDQVRIPFEAVLKGLDRGFWMSDQHTAECPWKNPNTNNVTDWGFSTARATSRNL